MAVAAAAFPQNINQTTSNHLELDLNGVKIGTKLLKSEVIKKFGKPDKYQKYTGLFENDEDFMEEYSYPDLKLYFLSSAGLTGFLLKTDSIPFCTFDVEGGIRIGDDIDKLKQLNPYDWKESSINVQKEMEKYSGIKGGTWYHFHLNEKDETNSCIVLVKNGKIAALDYTMIVY